MPAAAPQSPITFAQSPVPSRGPSPWYTIREAAEYLRCSRSFLNDMIARGQLPKHHFLEAHRGKFLLHRTELDALLGYSEQ